MKKQILLLLTLLVLFSADLVAQTGNISNTGSSNSMERNFLSPPASASPWVYWFWINGTVDRKGITADLEAMKRVGIGGVLIMDVSFTGQPQGQVRFMSEEWQSLFQFAIKEATRLGLKVRMNNDAGWTGSGGPWVKPKDAMQTVVSSQVSVIGGSQINIDLTQPPTKGDYYKDVAVLAVQDPALASVHMKDAHPSLIVSTYAGITTSVFPTGQHPLKLDFPNTDRFHQKLPSLTIHFDSPYTACNLDMVTAGPLNGWFKARLQVSDDGQKYRDVKTFSLGSGSSHFDNKGAVSLTFDMITASWYRIQFVETHTDESTMMISKVDVNPRYQIKNLTRKDLSFIRWDKGIQSAPLTTAAPEEIILPQKGVIDITRFMDSDGRLKWNAPEGHWNILRFGHTYTGETNHPAIAEVAGPEVNKLNKNGIQEQFNGLMKKLIDLAGPDAGQTKTLTSFHIDSWEVGSQNWTYNMREEFRKRRGYDITPFLPVMTGRIIGSQQLTERFLWDLRKTVSELMIENYVKEMQTLCHKHDMLFSFESYTTIGNDLDAASWVDEPMGEFWTRDGADIYDNLKVVSSAAHLNKRSIVGAESFTSREDERWLSHPATIKALGDKAFCSGINRFIIHRYAMQPWLNIRPGMSMFSSGLHYERTQPWWNYSLPWHTYVARCQYLLRQGVFVADVLNLQPEEPLYRFKELPLTGYDYDACGPDEFKRFKVEDGKLVNGSGNKYSLLVLTHTQTMTVSTLSHIRDMVLKGASILGDPPKTTPGLTNYPMADDTLNAMVKELWGDGTQHERKVGKGHVFRDISPKEALSKMSIVPDFTSDIKLNYIHRRINQKDIYFVANSTDSTIVANCTFRVEGKQPEWWDPETGKIKSLAAYTSMENGSIRIPLTLGPSGSGFIIFSPGKKSDAERVVEITCNEQILFQNGIVMTDMKTKNKKEMIAGVLNNEITLPGNYVFTRANGKKVNINVSPDEVKPLMISGPWELKFPVGKNTTTEVVLEQLKSWTLLPDKAINYFSGTGSYFKTISIPSSFLKKENKIFIDLGKVDVMAKVIVNGKEAGILWKPPYRLDVTSLVHEEKNNLQVSVVNLLINRQIGDEYLPEDSPRHPDGSLKTWPDWLLKGNPNPTGRHTFTNWRLWKRDDPLQPSGLLGPVKLEQIKLLK